MLILNTSKGHNKGKNSIDLTEAEGIKKRWQEYPKLY